MIIGRTFTPTSRTRFSHRSQHAIILPYLSSTHISISITFDETTQQPIYTLKDYNSSNGTYIKYHNSTDTLENATKLDPGQSVTLSADDIIVFKFGRVHPVAYRFTPLSTAPALTFPTATTATTNTDANAVPTNTTAASTTATITTPPAPIVATESSDILLKNQIIQLQGDLNILNNRHLQNTTKLEAYQTEKNNYERDIVQYKETIDKLNNDMIRYKDSIFALESNASATEAFRYYIPYIM